VDDSVHIEVQVVECGNRGWGNELGSEGIPLRDPAEKLRDTCAGESIIRCCGISNPR
jgi:hypothetical protein